MKFLCETIRNEIIIYWCIRLSSFKCSVVLSSVLLYNIFLLLDTVMEKLYKCIYSRILNNVPSTHYRAMKKEKVVFFV